MTVDAPTLQQDTAARWVGGYQLLRLLDRGRFSSVHLALDVRHSRRVVLKLAAEPAVQGEAEALSALAHRHVAQLLGQGHSGAQSWLAMEYIAGGAITSQPRPFGSARCFNWMVQAATALAWVHGRGWVHRDIKPSHLLLRQDGTLALVDFGSACWSGRSEGQLQAAVVGTPRYAAPEQTQGAAATPAADVYSLGVCLFELLAGHAPYPGETLLELFSQHLRAPVPALPEEHAAWQPVVGALLAKDPLQRPADGAAVLALLQAAAPQLLPPNDTGEPS